MSQHGVGNKVLSALKGIYENINCCAKVYGFLTDCFEVSTGFKYGCLLSPLSFTMFVSGLIDTGENVCALTYTDDLALIACYEKYLQRMLDCLHVWCEKWKMMENTTKSEIVQFCNKRVQMSHYYRYLGLILNEY